MNRQHLSRRIVLSAAVVGLAILATVGGADSALAEVRGGWGTKASFKGTCEKAGGVFIDSPEDGLTACFWPDGNKTVCDSNGNDCFDYPKKREETGWADPLLDSTGEATIGVEPTVVEERIDSGVDLVDVPLIADEPRTVTPVEAPPVATAATDVIAPVEDYVASDVESSDLAAPSDTLDTPAEEPIPAVASDDQP